HLPPLQGDSAKTRSRHPRRRRRGRRSDPTRGRNPEGGRAMIQAEPIYVVVTGEKQNRRAYFASRFQNQAQAFASAFAHDPARPRVEEYQTITMGADFYVGAKAFNVTMGRDDGVVGVDTKPGMWDFGYMNQSTDDSP